MKKLFALGASLVVLTLINACNTVEGVGQDVEAGGNKLEKSARENKGY